MKASCKEVAPTEKTYEVNLVLSQDELNILAELLGSVCGSGRAHDCTDKLWEVLNRSRTSRANTYFEKSAWTKPI